MDTAFAANVPDLATWGTYSTHAPNVPRNYVTDILDVTVAHTTALYADIVHDSAKAIASGRLQPHDLIKWENAVQQTIALSNDDRAIIARALARGIIESGNDPVDVCPPCNENNFKGHVVEVLLYCMRIHLLQAGQAQPILFQPRKPKAMSASGGIDLLEVGANGGGHYFHVWECKGTIGSLSSALNSAAAQLCDDDSTACQSFLESHRALQDSPEISNNPGLADFVREMPRLFYQGTAAEEKRLGAFAGCDAAANLAHTTYFATAINTHTHANHANCHAVVVRFTNFTHFLEDVYDRLWNIY